jgi:hypothetical protein
MRAKLLEHGASVLFVSAILLSAVAYFHFSAQASGQQTGARAKQFGDLGFVDAGDPFHKALLRDVVNIFYPDQYDRNDTAVASILSLKESQFAEKLQKSYVEEKLSWKKFLQLLLMYVKFLCVYAAVLALTYYGVQTLAVWRFVKRKQKASGMPWTIRRMATAVPMSVLKTAASLVLFSPAYVIAYSIRTEFNTDTIVFMALLGVISNGLLITYTNKFFAFLTAESRKGYVETALVKNVNGSYLQDRPDGIPLSAIVAPVKEFKGHVFDHIFKNARHQYLSTIKEQASFLITGLIIIEMALNIHGHLSYEMLRQLLNKNYDIVVVIILGIFYTVKLTEVVTDVVMHRESLKYENK